MAPERAETSLEQLEVEGGGVRLHVVAAGPAEAPPVVLLHGFPEGWLGWKRQIGRLARGGWRVLVPDQRGYGASDKPRPVSAYGLESLVGDVVTLLDALGHERARIAGHDWGAVVAWCVAGWHPERVERLAILNVPHPAVMERHLRRDVRQMFRSWYVLCFQLPWLPEALNRWGGHALMTRAMVASANPGTFSEADLAAYRQAWSEPGALRGMIHWYRAALRHRPRRGVGTIDVPTRILWGRGDAFLRSVMATESLSRCTDGELTWYDGATHWLQHEEPERVADELLEFFAPR